MANLGLDVLDKTVHETNEWLEHIRSELGTNSKRDAYHALRSVLFTLRDRVPLELAVHLGAQLPLLVRGIYYEGYNPGDKPLRYRSLEAWSERVFDVYDTRPVADAEALTRVVFNTLNEKLTQGLLDKVYTALPEDVRRLSHSPENKETH